MKKNISRLDQLLRLGISLVLIYIGFIDRSIIDDTLSSNILGIIGVINMIVAVARYCPLYVVADINTCQEKK